MDEHDVFYVDSLAKNFSSGRKRMYRFRRWCFWIRLQEETRRPGGFPTHWEFGWSTLAWLTPRRATVWEAYMRLSGFEVVE